MSDENISNKIGEYFNESHYKNIIRNNCDVYYKENGTKKLLLKLRKNVFPKSYCETAVECLRDVAQQAKDNRGAAAGKLDLKKLPSYVNGLVNKHKFRSGFIRKDGTQSKTATSNLALSNIIGFYDKPDRNLNTKGSQCRMTAFNRDEVEKWGRLPDEDADTFVVPIYNTNVKTREPWKV